MRRIRVLFTSLGFVQRERRLPAAVALAGASLVACAGCQSGESPPFFSPAVDRSLDAPPEDAIDPLLLGRELKRFAVITGGGIAGAANTIAARTTDATTREWTLRWKIASIPVINAAAADPDPRRGFLGAYIITSESLEFFSSKPEGQLFGDQQGIAVEAMASLRDRIAAIGERYFDAAALAEIDAEMVEYDYRHPISTLYQHPEQFIEGLQEKSGETSAAGAVLTAPLLPFYAMGGVGDTPAELRRLGQEFHLFAQMVSDIPERARWESELMLLNLESGETLSELRRTADRLSTSAESFAATTEALPERLRASAEELITKLEAQQEGVGRVLDETQRTLDEAQTLVTSINDGLTAAESTAASFKETGGAWDDTAQRVNEAMTTIREMLREVRENRPEGAPPFNINDYTTLAVEARDTIGRLNTLLSDAGAADMANLAGAADGLVRSSLDRFTLRVAMLIALFFSGLVVYRAVAVRMLPKP